MGMRISWMSKAGVALLFGTMCSATYAGGMDKMKSHEGMATESGKTEMMKEESEIKTMEGDMKAMEAEMPKDMQESMKQDEESMKMKERKY